MNTIDEKCFEKIINETRDNFNNYKKSNSNFKSVYLRCKQSFLQRIFGADKRFNQFYLDQEMIYQDGQIVWGHIVQANQLLFDKGEFDCPAAIIYSLDSEMDNKPYILKDAGYSLFEIKGVDTTPELSEFSRKLADEMEADWKLKIPMSLTNDIQCYYLTNMIFRKHLPNRFLGGSLFPIMVYPEKSDVGFILPSEFWTKEFIRNFWS